MKLKYNDKAHGYWLDGKRTKSVTAITSLPEDKTFLDRWKMRQLVIGLARQPELLKDFDEDDKRAGYDLVAAANDVAGTWDSASYGTAVHDITERGDRGEDLDAVDAVTYALWCELLDRAGLDVIPEYIEGVVVHVEQRICGRFDRYARRRSDGAVVCVDLKTGKDVAGYPHSICVQLAMYVNADCRCDIGPKGDGETEEFFSLPAGLDRKVGYVIHMPQEGEPGVYTVNLLLGWACAQQIIFPGLRWRAMPLKSLITKVA